MIGGASVSTWYARPNFGSGDAMRFALHPWQLFFLILAGWVNRQQQEVIELQNAQIP
ncbi:MAG: hypothetical protein ACI9DF_003339 [Verrucomicrobiales bacterium]|jgi:hypothetical protein